MQKGSNHIISEVEPNRYIAFNFLTWKISQDLGTVNIVI